MTTGQICPDCGSAAGGGARFCPQCGARIGEAPARHETRKVVTVLFSDVAGSTALGEKLDPESLRIVMTRYFGTISRVLKRHGGTIEKFIGDAVMAVFGVPVAREEDALRAVRAAVETRAALADLNDELEASWGVRIATRTGVNTGEVVAGDPSSGQLIVTGDAVNVAARLEQAAGADEILIGRQTEHLVRRATLLEPLPPLELKGKSEPVPAWRVLELLPDDSRVEGSSGGPLVGRAFELAQLQQSFERAVQAASCSLFTLLGAAGMGKSRVAAEFLAALPGNAVAVRGRCLPYGEGITYLPLVQIVEELAGAETDAGIRELLPDDPEAEQVAAVLREALEEAGATAETSDVFWAVRKLFEGVASERPLVVVVDDLHWAEATFLDLVDHLADWIRGIPVMLLCLARPELLESYATWGGGKLNATTMLLGPLSNEACQQLLVDLEGDFELHSTEMVESRERIVAVAEGNPLFIEHMLAIAHEKRSDAELEVPPTIHALLAARLDALDSEDRDLLDRASVIGREFWLDALLDLTPEEKRGEVRRRLEALTRRQLVAPASSPRGRAAYRFHDQLVCDTAYRGLSKGLRAELHEQFARWLERSVEDRPHELDEMIGYHFERAFFHRAQLGLADEKTKELEAAAGSRLGAAGRRALTREDLHAASHLLDRAAALLPPDSPDRIRLLFDLADAFFELGELTRCQSVLATAQAEAAVADPRLEAFATVRIRLVQARIEPSLAPALLAESAADVELLELPPQDHLAIGRACELAAHAHFVRQNLVEAEAVLERALGHVQLAGAVRQERRILSGLCDLALWGPRHVDEAIARVRGFVAHVHSNRRLRALALLSLAGLLAMRGDFDEARRLSNVAQSLLEELGLTMAIAGATHVTGTIELLARDGAAAERELRRGYEIFAELGKRGALASSAPLLAHALLLQGRLEEAERLVEETVAAAAEADVTAQVAWRTVQARILVARGETAEAERLAREAVSLGSPTDDLRGRGDAAVTLAAVLAEAGHRDEALALADEALELYERKGVRPSADEARALREELAA